MEWQAAVLDYQRGLQAGTASSGDSIARGLRWEAWGVREADDPSNPLSFAASREADSVLRAAGVEDLQLCVALRDRPLAPVEIA